MIDEKKMEKRLKTLYMLFFFQPLFMVQSLSNSSDILITLGSFIILSTISIVIGFGLKSRRQWARMAASILYSTYNCRKHRGHGMVSIAN